ncbi:MAG: DUF692 domain-containing protein [Blastocatellia bacterium]
MENLPKLGVGLGFREQFRSDIFLHSDIINFLEITSDHYLDAMPRKIEELELLRQHFPLIPHSLELSLGSAEGIDEEYLEKLSDLINRIKPPWFSDHICFTKSNGISIGHLASVPYTKEALRVFTRNIELVRKRISTPMILENITYNVRFPSSEMSEAEFIRRLLDETDCGMLLDVTNLYINSVNLEYDWRKFLDELPMDRVVQLHFVGSHSNGARLIDAHANKTEDEIWNVFREVCVRCDIKGAVLERDENFPSFAEILDEMETAGRNMNETFFVPVA